MLRIDSDRDAPECETPEGGRSGSRVEERDAPREPEERVVT